MSMNRAAKQDRFTGNAHERGAPALGAEGGKRLAEPPLVNRRGSNKVRRNDVTLPAATVYAYLDHGSLHWLPPCSRQGFRLDCDAASV